MACPWGTCEGRDRTNIRRPWADREGRLHESSGVTLFGLRPGLNMGKPASLGGQGARASLLVGLSSVVLGELPATRKRVSQQLFASLLVVASALIVWHGAHSAGTPAFWIHTWLATVLGSSVLIYAMLRSRWSERLSDPAMTQPQIVLGLTFAWCGYPMMGAQRGLVITVVLVTLAFGMFRLRRGQSLCCAALTLALQGLAMSFSAWVWPRQFDWVDERAHAMAGVILVVAMAFVADQLSRIRGSLIAQREELNQALARIETLATHDALTGLPNRRRAEELLEQNAQLLARQGTPFCVAVVDLDHFKRINDGYGHPIGDSVLRSFAEAALKTLRAGDGVARWGGEEFLIVLANTAMPTGVTVLERVRRDVAAIRVPVSKPGEAPLSFSFSAGIAQAWAGETSQQLLERTDQAMYRAKREGRDRVVVA